MRSTLITLLVTCIVFISHHAFAGAFGYQKRALTSFLEASWLTTTKNLDSSGAITPLPGDFRYKENKYDLDVNYDWSNKFATFANFSFKRNASLDNTLERTNSAPSDLGVGADYLLYSGPVRIIPQVAFTLPLHSVNESTNDLLIGDGAMTLTPRIHVTRDFTFFAASANVGYRYRSRGLSHQIPYGIVLRKETKDFHVEGGLEGVSSASKDNEPNTLREQINSRVNAGSNIYNSRNPAGLNLVTRVGWRFDSNILITAGLDHTLAGANSYYGTRYMLGLSITEVFGGGRKRLGQINAASHLEDDEESDRDEEAAKKKKFKVQGRPEEDTTPQLEPFEVEIRRARPEKKPVKKSPSKTKQK